MIFLAFIVFGGKEAIFISTIETLFTCLILKYQGIKFDKLTFFFNIASNALSTAISYQIWTTTFYFTNVTFNPHDIGNLISSLGILALSQFFTNSIFASIYHGLKNHSNFFDVWKKDGFSISITQIAGACIAGVAFKLINNGDYFATGIAFVVLVVAYFNYRKVINDMTASIEEAELAQKEKAESERVKAEQAEKHAEELGLALAEQERVSEQLKESNHALEHSAFYDSLTDLPNRTYLIERLRLLFELNIDIANKYYILFLDLKRFKNINNRLGHAVGDKVLVMISRRLLRLVKMEDTVARLGGDEFAIILNDLKSPEEAIKYARKISQKLSQPFSLQGHKIFVSVNIGISPFEPEHKKPEDILRDADIAMHYSKEKETDYALFDKDLRSRVMETIKLESNLRFALDKHELSMYYQPLISLDDGEIIGFEALLRWHHPTLGFVPPAKFIPIAEDSGLIIPITDWILKETTHQVAQWQQIGPNYRNLMVSVNISGKHIAQDGLVEAVKKSLKTSRLRPAALKLEITESTAMEDAERTVEVLTRLKQLGTQLSIDDFGTGYSSLNYLHRLPFDTLKIDRSFVYNVGEQGENSEILQTIISLAKNLKMRVIAEGIETESQLRVLRNLGCDYGQGYLMSKPLPREEIENLLYRKHLWFPESFMEKEFGTPDAEEIAGDVIYSSKVS
jgi:diguanylate cyclase (GGDEF)-like protein